MSKHAAEFLPLLDLKTPIVPAVHRNNAGIIGAAGARRSADASRRRREGRMGRPVRRVLSGGVSPVDGHLSRRHVAVPLQRPTRGLGEPRQHPLSGLAPGEVYLASRVTATPVVSYTTVSPLPRPKPWRSVLCGTVSRITPGGCYPPPCPVEPGRSSARRRTAATRPSSRPIRGAESSRRRLGAALAAQSLQRGLARCARRAGSRSGSRRRADERRMPRPPAPPAQPRRRSSPACAR